MATNMYKKYTEAKTEEWVVGTHVAPGTLVIEATSGRVGVTLTGSGDYKISANLPDGSVLSNIDRGGVGNKPTAATVAVDGSFIFPIAGAVNGETVTPGAGTPKGTKVYRLTGGGLTLTVGTNTLVGFVDDGTIVAGSGPVLIGASL